MASQEFSDVVWKEEISHLTGPTNHNDEQSMEDHFDRRGQTVTEGEIKCGELQFFKCDEDAGEIETATRKQDLRLFRLTTETLKCFQQHGQGEVETIYSLSNIEKIDYDDKGSDPTSFRLLLSTSTIVLQAKTPEDARDWVEKIRDAIKRLASISNHSDEDIKVVREDYAQEIQAAQLASVSDEEGNENEDQKVTEVMEDQLEIANEKSKDEVASKREDKQHLLSENDSKDTIAVQGTETHGHGLPFLTELQCGRKKSHDPFASSTTFTNPLVTEEFPSSSASIGEEIIDTDRMRHDGALKTGVLSKTTIGRREGSRSGPTRHRHFRLTEVALEYLHHFSHVKVKRSFPLTSIEEVDYDETNEPTTFRLIFSNCIEVLQAETVEDTSDWVDKIVDACKKWHISQREESFDESEPEEEGEGIGESADPQRTEDDLSSLDRMESDSESVSKKRRFTAADFRQRSFTSPLERTADNSYKFENDRTAFTGWKKRLRKTIYGKEKLSSQPNKSNVTAIGSDLTLETRADFQKNYPMIKYPRRKLGLPNEKVFKMDANNMQILWKRTQRRSKFHRSRSLSLHRVVEVREGQKTDMFDKFPYEQVENQSFSLLYQKEDTHYAYLESLDLICDQEENYNFWIDELKPMIESQSICCTHPKLSSEDNDSTDSTILWLKQIWSCTSDRGELSEKEAIKLAKKLNPFITEKTAKDIVMDTHKYRVKSADGLDFEGYILMVNLIGDTTDSRLHSVFREYAKASPQLGMTLQEFREFLVNECCWQRKLCTKTVLRKLMRSHDQYHEAYKKYTANNSPTDYVLSRKLLSFAGFVSFLRSKDNSVIDPEHETVYQDMTQPLSHYFINSSHNTYLEGHQINGKSSNEAYTRVLLQGCRCIEIDCWDDTLNITNLSDREPIIYHGYTLTTKLPFRDVIHTIKDYAFRASPYPVVISIENHCNKAHQAKMAVMFNAIFEELLPQEDLVELEGRARLPSPEELRHKIILKSPVKEKEQTKGRTLKTKRMPKLWHSSASLSKTSTCTLKTTDSSTCSLKLVEENAAGSSHDSEELIKSSQPKQPDPTAASNKVEEEVDGKLNKGVLRHSFRRRQLKEIQKKVKDLESEKDDQEGEFIETAEDLSSLIIYAKCKYIKPWNWEEQKKSEVTHLFSFGEPTAVKLCTFSTREMLACTERHLVRTYPKGTRFDSSNYDPFIMWVCGIQLTTLNFQTPDTYMHLNQGFFRRNGGCGYVLKPAVMRKEDAGGGSTPFDPVMQAPHPDVPAVDFEIELISGQRLCPWKKKCSSVTVAINTYGITHDCTHIEPASHDNALWPNWEEGQHHLKKTFYMPELCLVYFKVESDRKLFGQNCIPVVSLQPGLKFIPLRTPGGELIPGSGLFVKIKKSTAATTEETPRESGEAKETPPLHMRKISRQEVIEDEENDTSTATAVSKREENEDEDSNDTEIGKSASYRRFSSPAVLESPLRDSSQLTVVAEVCEDTAL